MAEVVLFHHAQGLTSGVLSFADQLGAAGHLVHTPDLYEGQTFDTLEAGVEHGDNVLGMETVLERAHRTVEDLPERVVYAGFSLGAIPAQMLAQTRPGAKGAVLMHACVDPVNFGAWPHEVRLQVHSMEGDEWFEPDVARALVGGVGGAELFLYPGSGHLFADRDLEDYDEPAATLLTERVLGLLDATG